ncbi:unnamed protein product, partial [Heterosigma akashiwo]
YRVESLRDHQKSKSHQHCLRVKARLEREAVVEAAGPMDAVLADLCETTRMVQRNKLEAAKWLAKEKLAGAKFGSLCGLLKKLGVDVGETHLNEQGFKIYASLLSHYVDERKGENISSSRFSCFSSDGTDDSAHIAQESIFIRVVVGNEPQVYVVGLAALSHHDAASLWESIKKELVEKQGLSLEVLQKSLVAICLDGAAVNMGVIKGLQAHVRREVGEWILVVHCCAHNFELALKDLKKAFPYIGKLDKITMAIFKLYHWSSKLHSELNILADALEETIVQFGSLKQMRWSASALRALQKIQISYKILTQHLESLAAGKHKKAPKARGLLRLIKSVKFLKHLNFLLDIFEPCSVLSKCLQPDKLLITDVEDLLDRAIEGLEELKDGQGPNMMKFFQNYDRENKMYDGVVLHVPGVRTRHQRHQDEEGDQAEFIRARFAKLSEAPLCYFKDAFDVDVITFADERDVKNVGVEALTNLIEHFGPLFEEEEKEAMLREFLPLKKWIRKMKKNSPSKSDYDLYSAVLGVAKEKQLENIGLLVEIMFVVTPSVA